PFSCFFFQAEDGIRDGHVTGVQTCALPIFAPTPSCDFHSFPQGMKLNSESRSCPRRRRYGDRVSRAACNITSITRFGSVYIGVWSTWCDLTFALIRSAMKRCVLGLIMRSSSASRNHEGLVFHAGTGADS